MKNTLLLVLTFSGVYVLSTNLFREYHYVNIPKTWAKAQQYCREVYGDLATVDSIEESSRLFTALQEPGKFAWIGLYDNITGWKWTMGEDDFDFVGENGFPPWEKNQPDNAKGKQSCIVMNYIGGWRDEDCDSKRRFICFDEKAASKYIPVNILKTWEDAKNYCRSEHTDLVRVWNMSQNNEIHRMFGFNHWMGLYRDLWANWSDQSPVTFTNWEVGQPDNSGSTDMTSCAAVKTDTGKWWDVDCSEEHEFICQTLIPPRRRIKLSFQSEADLTDPHIQQQILEQLHSKLEMDGITDFKLRWVEKGGQVFHKKKSQNN
ncbi:PREDICTED: macrophage mannose receptor 1-like [Cyprinodon variegatus]|uniref:macrophage mannose receptor 1-like n=1 Tax=Cyprinodon variegatus TaxID=28743 RepID=UPI0007428274|nr:PREDICTED: macrophage mannose receptor 1-like [Cyprinodon variegatus]